MAVKWIGLIFAFASFVPAMASIPGGTRDGVLQTGSSLQRLLRADAPLQQEFIDQLQRKIHLMVVETDVQIQAERLALASGEGKKSKDRLDLLIRLNTAALEAEREIRALRGRVPERNMMDHLPEILPESKKVRDIFEAYAKLSSDDLS